MLLLAGFERVYELDSVFRNEGESAQLLPEFTNLDALASWVTYDDIKELGIALTRRAAHALDRDLGTIAQYHLSEFNLPGTDEERVRAFKKNIAPTMQGLFIVDGYPASLAPTAARNPTAPEQSQEYRIFIDGRSCVHGYLFATEDDGRAEEATRRVEERGRPVLKEYEQLARYGLPPSGGIGIGIEKFVQLCTKNETIKQAQFFRK